MREKGLENVKLKVFFIISIMISTKCRVIKKQGQTVNKLQIETFWRECVSCWNCEIPTAARSLQGYEAKSFRQIYLQSGL